MFKQGAREWPVRRGRLLVRCQDNRAPGLETRQGVLQKRCLPGLQAAQEGQEGKVALVGLAEWIRHPPLRLKGPGFIPAKGTRGCGLDPQ